MAKDLGWGRQGGRRRWRTQRSELRPALNSLAASVFPGVVNEEEGDGGDRGRQGEGGGGSLVDYYISRVH